MVSKKFEENSYLNGEEGYFTHTQMGLCWVLSSSEVATVVSGINSEAELEENLSAITKEGQLDERVLDRYLQATKSLKAQERQTIA